MTVGARLDGRPTRDGVRVLSASVKRYIHGDGGTAFAVDTTAVWDALPSAARTEALTRLTMRLRSLAADVADRGVPWALDYAQVHSPRHDDRLERCGECGGEGVLYVDAGEGPCGVCLGDGRLWRDGVEASAARSRGLYVDHSGAGHSCPRCTLGVGRGS